MKTLSRIDRSICGAVLSNRTPAARTSTGSTFWSGDSQPRSCRQLHISTAHHRSGATGHCPHTSTWLSSTFIPLQSLSIAALLLANRRTKVRTSHSAAAAVAPYGTPPGSSLNRHELLSLVDQEGAGTVEEHLLFVQDPYLRRYAQSDGPNLRVSDRRDDVRYPSYDQAVSGSEETADIVRRLAALVVVRLRNPRRVSPETLYRLYCALPEHRMLHLPATVRHRLLRALGAPERRDTTSMLRYLAVVADVKNCGLTLRRAEWNYALAYARGYVGGSGDVDLETTLRLWKEMERDAGIRGNDVTFNILFDVASKAGNFVLAEMIYKEMEARGFKFNRYHHVSLIHFFGLKMDADGVRAAYKEMVETGEIIDTVVLNCVISGLLRSGEDAAAEQVYERMKGTHAKAPDLPQRDYVTDKIITKVLMMFSRLGKKHPPMLPTFQDVSIVAPDLHTYKLLVNHFGVKVGDLNKVARFLDEMKWFQVPLHGAIFLALFKGFSLHGGISGSTWSDQRLRSVFSALLQALDDGARGMYIDTWLAMYALRAFMKCSSRDAVMETYASLESRWQLDAGQRQFMADFLHNLLRRNGGAIEDGIEGLPKLSSGEGNI